MGVAIAIDLVLCFVWKLQVGENMIKLHPNLDIARNLQQYPLFTDPEQTWAFNLIARLQLTERGPLGFGPIQFLMEISNH